MTIKNIALATVLSTALLFSAAANANEAERQYYVQFNSGIAHGMKTGSDFGKKNMGNTGVYGLEAGYKFDENFRASVSFDYLPGFKNKYTSSEVIDGFSETSQSQIKVKSYVTMLNLYYDIAEFSGFTPYVTIGAGMARNKSGQFKQNSVSELNDNTITTVPGATKNNFAYKLGLGTRYAINNAFDLDLRYQYQDLGKFKTGSTGVSSVNGRAPNNKAFPVKQGKLRVQEILVGVVYKF